MQTSLSSVAQRSAMQKSADMRPFPAAPSPARPAMLRATRLSAAKPSVRLATVSSKSISRYPDLPSADSLPQQSPTEPSLPTSQDVNALNSWWNSVPARSKIVMACASSFMLSNMDKVNMTVAIIPMAQELGWSSTVSGLVQSAFFWGFLLAQVPGGYLSSTKGGHNILPPSVILWSSGTAILPFAAASSMPALFFARAVVGVGEACAPSSIVDMLARTIPKEQRAGAVAAAFSGLHIGSIIGLLLSPALIDIWGWRALFVVYGLLGGVWYVGFKALLANVGQQEPEVLKLLDTPKTGASAVTEAGGSASGHIPYRAMLRSQPVQALMFTHLCHNWFQYTMLAWLPTYFVQTLDLNLVDAAHTALLPPMAGVAASAVAGRAADFLVASGLPVPVVRKAAQCTAFLGPSALLAACSTDAVSSDPTLTIGCITAALGMSSFSLAGLYCTHQDLSPKYASAMLGLSNTAASLPGVVGVAMVGMLLDKTGGSWELALFAPTATFLLMGSIVYTFLGRNDAIDFDAANNAPFLWESKLQPAVRMWERLSSSASALVQRLR